MHQQLLLFYNNNDISTSTKGALHQKRNEAININFILMKGKTLMLNLNHCNLTSYLVEWRFCRIYLH